MAKFIFRTTPKVDKKGNKEWDVTFGGGNFDCAFSLSLADDGGLVITGIRDADDIFYGGNLWILKLKEKIPPKVNVIYPNGEEIIKGKTKIKWNATDNACKNLSISIKYSPDNGLSWYTIASGLENTGFFEINTSLLEDSNGCLIMVNATDKAGNNGYDVSNNAFTIDNTPPETICNLTGKKGNKGWWRSNVNVTLIAKDETTKVNETFYKLDDGNWVKYEGYFVVYKEGYHNLSYYSTDIAGNVEKVKKIKFKIDKTKPSIAIKRPKNAIYIFNRKIFPLIREERLIGIPLIFGKIVIEGNYSDAISGIERVEYYVDDELKYINDEKPYYWEWDKRIFFKHIIKVKAYDNAGNFATDEFELRIFNLNIGGE